VNATWYKKAFPDREGKMMCHGFKTGWVMKIVTVLCVLAVLLSSAFAAEKLAPVESQQGPEIFVQLGHSSGIESVFFTSDGSYLVSGDDKAIKIWEAATGREIRTLRQSDKMSAFAVTPDDKKILAGDKKGHLHLWDITTGKSLGKFTGKAAGAAATIAVSPDGRHAISTHYSDLAYWDMVKKKQIFVLDREEQGFSKGYVSHIKTAAFLSGSNRIAMGIEVVDKNYKTRAVNMEIYDVKKRKTVKNYEVLKGDLQVNSFAVSPDEKYFFMSVAVAKSGGAIDSTSKLLVVDSESGKIVKEMSFPWPFYNVAFSPRGNYAAAANFGEVIIYETGNWNEVKKIGGARLPLAFSPDGQSLLYVSSSETSYYGEMVFKEGLDLFDLKSWQRVRRFSGNVDSVASGKFLTQDREIISPHWLILYWDREKGALSKSLTLKDSSNRKVTVANGNAFSSDGKYAIVGNDYGSYICDLPGGQLKKIMDKPLAIVDFAPDNKSILFSTYDRKIVLWDIENNRSVRQFADWGNKAKLFIHYNKLSRDGQYVVADFEDYERQEEDQKLIVVWDAQTGRQVKEIKFKNSIFSLVLSPDGKNILTGEFSGTDDSHDIVMRGMMNGKIIKRFKGHKDIISALAFSPDGKFLLSGSWDQNIILWDAGSGKKIKTFSGHAGFIQSLDFSLNLKYFISTSRDGTMRLWDIAAGREIAQFITFIDGEWIVITPEGYFNASRNGAKHLNVRLGNKVFSIDSLYEKFFNPVYVASVLQGKKVEAVADIRKGILSPPDVRITSPAPGQEFSKDMLTVTVTAKDTGGGIDGIRLYHNGKAIGEDQRGLKLVSKDGEAVKDYSVTLVDGLNTFRATGFSKDRTESNPYELIVKLTAPSKDVSLYVLAIGINQYKNPALNLNYAEPDARGIAEFFKGQGKGLFKNVDIREIYNEQATKENIVSKLSQLQNINPQDAVVIYLAGHGETINDKWYFIPHDLTYPEREEDVKIKGLSSDELNGYMKNIKAQKILMLIDACKSGAVLIAFRGFEDRKALSQLSRSTGVHIVAASTKDQFAAEVKELGHGVFTYTLLEGLGGKAAGKGESVTVRKLMGYVEEQLPEITKKYKQEAQYPVVDSRGMDFPLVIAK
jgi:WD40 repeat protein